MLKSVILFISNLIYFLNLVSCLIQLFDFESLLDFYLSLEIINSLTNFFIGLFSYSLTNSKISIMALDLILIRNNRNPVQCHMYAHLL